MNGATQKHHAQIATAIRFLEFMLLDPVARVVATAPPDDEPVTEQDRRRFHAGQAWFAQRGKGIPMEDVLAEFGLKPEDSGELLLGKAQRGPDEDLLFQFDAISRFNDEEKKVVRSVLECLLLPHEVHRWSAGASAKENQR
jgi:hypothetical protein